MTKSFTETEVRLIKSRIDQAYFSLAKVYVPFLAGLFLAYQLAKGKTSNHISSSQYNTIYIIVFSFFFAVFFFFCYRDYKKKVQPYKKEMRSGSKNVSSFTARKYFDPIYGQRLLYHPLKENKYIQLSEDEYNSITEGQEIALATGTNTGIILSITINGKVMSDVEEFSFS